MCNFLDTLNRRISFRRIRLQVDPISLSLPPVQMKLHLTPGGRKGRYFVCIKPAKRQRRPRSRGFARSTVPWIWFAILVQLRTTAIKKAVILG